MLHSNQNRRSTPRHTNLTAALLSAGTVTLALAPFLAVGSAAGASAAPTVLSQPQTGATDKVFAKHKKTGKVQAKNGVVNETGLTGVKYTDRSGENETLDATTVVQIQWGNVPTSFTDGETYAKRSEWENAVANFQTAAADTDTRGVVQTAARLRALECMMLWGASDPARFTDAIAEADRFLSDHGQDWKAPTVRGIKARATWLSGDPAGARDGYRALFDAGKDGGKGYSPLATAHAALQGARAALESSETSTARELFDRAASAFGAVDSSDASTMAAAKAGEEEARLATAESQLSKETSPAPSAASNQASRARRPLQARAQHASASVARSSGTARSRKRRSNSVGSQASTTRATTVAPRPFWHWGKPS